MKKLVLALALVLPALALADDRGQRPPGPPPGPPPGVVLPQALEDADLDPRTLARAQALLAAAKPELDALREALHEREHQLLDDVQASMTEEEWARVREGLPRPPEGRPGDDGAPPARR